MKKNKNNSLKSVLMKLYKLLNKRQKITFIIIIVIMIVSAALTQITPKAIGWLTDDILTQNEVAFQKVIPFLLLILVVNVVNEVIKIVRRVMVEDTATRTEKNARGMVIKSLLMAPLAYFRENMTGNIHGRMNRCLEGTVKLEKLLFMDFAPAVFNSIAAIITIFLTLPVILALPMMLVIPFGVFIVFKQISSQKGIRVELLESKSEMDGTIVELINGIEVIRISDSVDFETNRFDAKSEFLRKKEMKHHKAMALYDCLKFINQAFFTVCGQVISLEHSSNRIYEESLIPHELAIKGHSHLWQPQNNILYIPTLSNYICHKGKEEGKAGFVIMQPIQTNDGVILHFDRYTFIETNNFLSASKTVEKAYTLTRKKEM